MNDRTAQRRWAMEQAIANAKIEGFIPDQDFLTVANSVVNGEVSTEEAIASFVADAHAGDRAARKEG